MTIIDETLLIHVSATMPTSYWDSRPPAEIQPPEDLHVIHLRLARLGEITTTLAWGSDAFAGGQFVRARRQALRFGVRPIEVTDSDEHPPPPGVGRAHRGSARHTRLRARVTV